MTTAIVGGPIKILSMLPERGPVARTVSAVRRALRLEPILNAVDMSRWGGPLTADEADALIRRGIRLLIVGTGNPNPGGAGEWSRQQGQMWTDRGGEFLDAYIYLYFAGNARGQVATAVSTMRGLPVRRWWQDAEDIDPACQAMSVAARELFLSDALDAGESNSLDQGIYSGRWWWNPYMAGSKEFHAYPLWDSYYPAGADETHVILAPWAGREYGGFASPQIQQYRGTYVLDGQSVDLDVADLGEEETVALKDQLERLLVSSWGAAGEQDLPWAERVVNADYRQGQAILGKDDAGKPFWPLAGRAVDLDIRVEALEHAAPAPGGIVRAHRHQPGDVIQA